MHITSSNVFKIMCAILTLYTQCSKYGRNINTRMILLNQLSRPPTNSDTGIVILLRVQFSKKTQISTTKHPLEVTPTTPATFSSYDREPWIVTLTFELDLDSVNLNHRAKYLGKRSFRSKVTVRIHRHTHTHRRVCFTWTTQVVGNKIVWNTITTSIENCRGVLGHVNWLTVASINRHCSRVAGASCHASASDDCNKRDHSPRTRKSTDPRRCGAALHAQRPPHD